MSEEAPAYLFTFYALRSSRSSPRGHPDALNEIHHDGEGKTRLKIKYFKISWKEFLRRAHSSLGTTLSIGSRKKKKLIKYPNRHQSKTEDLTFCRQTLKEGESLKNKEKKNFIKKRGSLRPVSTELSVFTYSIM